MNLYLLRHGIAGELGHGGIKHDADRPLTAEGRARIRGIAQAMQTLNLSFDLILASPYLRARQTAEIVAEQFQKPRAFQLSELLTPEGNSKKLLTDLNQHRPASENVLLVGHEPGLSRLISTLVFGDGTASVLMKKGGLCKLSTNSFRTGRCATLEWLLTPRQLLQIAGVEKHS